jgi:hypothetical protein
MYTLPKDTQITNQVLNDDKMFVAEFVVKID